MAPLAFAFRAGSMANPALGFGNGILMTSFSHMGNAFNQINGFQQYQPQQQPEPPPDRQYDRALDRPSTAASVSSDALRSQSIDRHGGSRDRERNRDRDRDREKKRRDRWKQSGPAAASGTAPIAKAAPASSSIGSSPVGSGGCADSESAFHGSFSLGAVEYSARTHLSAAVASRTIQALFFSALQSADASATRTLAELGIDVKFSYSRTPMLARADDTAEAQPVHDAVALTKRSVHQNGPKEEPGIKGTHYRNKNKMDPAFSPTSAVPSVLDSADRSEDPSSSLAAGFEVASLQRGPDDSSNSRSDGDGKVSPRSPLPTAGNKRPRTPSLALHEAAANSIAASGSDPQEASNAVDAPPEAIRFGPLPRSTMQIVMCVPTAAASFFSLYGEVTRTWIDMNDVDSGYLLAEFANCDVAAACIALLDGVVLTDAESESELVKVPSASLLSEVQLQERDEKLLTEIDAGSTSHVEELDVVFRIDGSLQRHTGPPRAGCLPKNAFPPSVTLHVSNLPDPTLSRPSAVPSGADLRSHQNVLEARLRELFSAYGEVLDVRFAPGTARMAYATMDSPRAALEALMALHNVPFPDKLGRRIKISFAKSGWAPSGTGPTSPNK
jgi:hypothetical protein